MEENPSKPCFKLRSAQGGGQDSKSMIKPFFFILSTALLTGLAHAQPKTSPYPPEVPKPTYSEVSYGKHERNVLDFWKAASKAPAPVAFVIHGGGWKGGSKERLPRFADPNALLKAGISVAAINYRYVTATEKPPVKAPLHDAARALQFVRSKAREWNADKKRSERRAVRPERARACGLPFTTTWPIPRARIRLPANPPACLAPQSQELKQRSIQSR